MLTLARTQQIAEVVGYRVEKSPADSFYLKPDDFEQIGPDVYRVFVKQEQRGR